MNENRNGFNPMNQAIAAEVRASLARNRWTKKDLADVLDIHPNVAYRKINGEVGFTAAELVSTAEALHTTVGQLINDARTHAEATTKRRAA